MMDDRRPAEVPATTVSQIPEVSTESQSAQSCRVWRAHRPSAHSYLHSIPRLHWPTCTHVHPLRPIAPSSGYHHDQHVARMSLHSCASGNLLTTRHGEYLKRPSGGERVKQGLQSNSKAKVANTSSFASSNGAGDYLVEFTFVPRPLEPNDVDNFVCCPPPEPCIINDGIMFRDRLANSHRRGTDLLGSMRESGHMEYYSAPSSRRRINRSVRESLQMPALIAPDLVATKIID